MSGPRNRGIFEAWSQRKARVRAEEEALARRRAARQAAEARERREAEHAGRSDAEILAALDLPDPDQLGAEDDFTAFMRAAIPERLRRRALRRLWGVDPLLANVDGLVDYGEDFTRSETAWRAVESVWQAGRERLPDDREKRRAKDAPGAPPPPDAAATGAARLERVDDVGADDPTHRPTHPGARAAANDRSADIPGAGGGDRGSLASAGAAAGSQPPPTRPAARRRMRFAFTPSTEMDGTSR